MEFIKLMGESLEQSLFFFPFSLGIYLSYAILKTTDMTTEGSFILGAGLSARLLSSGMGLMVAVPSAIFCGMLAGLGVSLIQAKNRVNPLIAGIIALFMLYSLNFQIMGRPNIGLPSAVTCTKHMLFLIISMIGLLICLMLASRFGMVLRAFGVNQKLLASLGKNPETYRRIGLSTSTALAALAGIIAVLVNGYADLNMGFGMTLTGIGTVVMGEQISKRFISTARYHALLELFFCFLGVYLYFFMINLFLSMGLEPIYLKLFLGVILIVVLRQKLS